MVKTALKNKFSVISSELPYNDIYVVVEQTITKYGTSVTNNGLVQCLFIYISHKNVDKS